MTGHLGAVEYSEEEAWEPAYVILVGDHTSSSADRICCRRIPRELVTFLSNRSGHWRPQLAFVLLYG